VGVGIDLSQLGVEFVKYMTCIVDLRFKGAFLYLGEVVLFFEQIVRFLLLVECLPLEEVFEV